MCSIIFSFAGAPSIPDVNIFVENSNTNSSLKLKISQRGESAICVKQYAINLTSSNSGLHHTQMIYKVNSASTNVTFNGLNLCQYNYTVSVTAMDFINSRSEPFEDIINTMYKGKL